MNIEQSAADPLKPWEASSTTIPKGSTLFSAGETGDIPKDTLIYALIDPLTGQVRYVGKTCQEIEKRYKAHLSDKTKSKKVSWIKSLKRKKLVPIIKVIDKVHDWDKAEKYYVSLYSKAHKLTNMTEGGKHTVNITKEVRQKMSQARKGVKQSWYHGKPLITFPVDCYNLDGTLYKFYESVQDAAKEIKGLAFRIREVCDGKMQCHKKKIWRRKGESFSKAYKAKSKTILQLKDNTLIKEYSSITSAAKSLKCLAPNISRVLRGERNHFRGFVFRYKDIV